MLYTRFIASLFSGAFAGFSAIHNGHVSELMCTESVGGDTVMRFRCSKQGSFIASLSLDAWTHEQSLARSDREVRIVDLIDWDGACTARRSYLIEEGAEGGVRRRVVAPWVVRYSAGNRITNAIVSRSMARELEDADDAVFDDFLSKIRS